MTTEALKELLDSERYSHHYTWWEKFPNKRASRADLHAFLILDELVPSADGLPDMVTCAAHHQIWLNVTLEDLAAANPTPQQCEDLVGCGVWVDSENDCLSLFV